MDTPETAPVEGAEILRLLRTIDAQTRANGESLTKCVALLSDVHGRLAGLPPAESPDQLMLILQHLVEIGAVVEEARPLLASGPARALKGGSTVLGLLSARRRPERTGTDG